MLTILIGHVLLIVLIDVTKQQQHRVSKIWEHFRERKHLFSVVADQAIYTTLTIKSKISISKENITFTLHAGHMPC